MPTAAETGSSDGDVEDRGASDRRVRIAHEAIGFKGREDDVVAVGDADKLVRARNISNAQTLGDFTARRVRDSNSAAVNLSSALLLSSASYTRWSTCGLVSGKSAIA